MTTLTTDRSDALICRPLLTKRIQLKLRRLRRALRGRLLAEGVAWLVVVSVGMALVTLALDYVLRLERPQRILVMAGALVGVAWVVWRELIDPLCVAMGQGELALLVERHYPHLQSRLISAIQFGSSVSHSGASASMIARTADEANHMADQLDFAPIVRRTSMWRAVKIALCATGLMAGLAVWRGDLVRLWAQRNLAFAEVPWPQKTYLTVEGDDFPVLRGDDLTVKVAIARSSVAPRYITVNARYPSVGWTEDQIEASAGDPHQFEIDFRAVSEPFEFYVVGGDDRRDRDRPHNVTLVDPPALRDVLFTVEYPSYMNRPPLPVGGEAGVVVVPIGGCLAMDMIATKDIAAASMSLMGDEGETFLPLRIETIACAGSAEPRPRRLLGRLDIAGANEPEVRSLQLHLTDSEGYKNRRGGRYFIHIQPDLPPAVDMKKTDVGQAVAPNAIIPLLVRAKDDSGIAAAQVTLSCSRGNVPAHAETIDVPPDQDGLKEFTLRHELDLEGLGLRTEDVIVLAAEATDILPKELGGPNVGESASISLRIVQPEKLLEELVSRQKTVRIEFMQALEQQESARARTAAAADELAARGAITPEVLARLADSTGQQGSVGTEVSKAAEKLTAILIEMTYNRLGESEDRQDMQARIIDPLWEVFQDSENIASALTEASELVDAGAMGAAADRIVGQQRDIRSRMDEILQRMEKLQSRQDLANKLQIIIRWAEKNLESIRRQETEKVRGIWDR